MKNVHLNAHQRKTLEAIFRHPIAHNLDWRDVRELLGHIGALEVRPNGEFDIYIGLEHITLEKPNTKDIDTEELRYLQTFLKKVGFDPARSASQGELKDSNVSKGPEYVVVIDHHQARLFLMHEEKHGHVKPLIIAPLDPHGFLRHLEHRKEADYQGERVPEDHEYYGRVSAALKSASAIVVLSRGTGKSNAGEYFVEYLQHNHPDLGRRVLAVLNVDLSHMTDGELVAAGRAHFLEMVA